MITTNKLKILCLCKGGLVRSVALKRFIVENYIDTDVIAAGGVTVQMDATRDMLLNWAELVFVVSKSAYVYLKKKYEYNHASKLVYLPIGKDTWLDPSHPQLVELIKTKFAQIVDEHIRVLRGSNR